MLRAGSFFFFFNDTATTEIYTLSLHDALPICRAPRIQLRRKDGHVRQHGAPHPAGPRSEEHTSELQSQSNLVCRLLLEKKKQCAHFQIVFSEEAAFHATIPDADTDPSNRAGCV